MAETTNEAVLLRERPRPSLIFHLATLAQMMTVAAVVVAIMGVLGFGTSPTPFVLAALFYFLRVRMGVTYTLTTDYVESGPFGGTQHRVKFEPGTKLEHIPSISPMRIIFAAGLPQFRRTSNLVQLTPVEGRPLLLSPSREFLQELHRVAQARRSQIISGSARDGASL